MKNRLSQLLVATLVTVIAIPLTSSAALAGGYDHGGRGYRGDHHGGYYRGNPVWAAVGVGLLGGALIAATRPPVYYPPPPAVYVPPPVYVEPPAYAPQPIYVPPPTYLRYDPWCRCYR